MAFRAMAEGTGVPQKRIVEQGFGGNFVIQ